MISPDVWNIVITYLSSNRDIVNVYDLTKRNQEEVIIKNCQKDFIRTF